MHDATGAVICAQEQARAVHDPHLLNFRQAEAFADRRLGTRRLTAGPCLVVGARLVRDDAPRRV